MSAAKTDARLGKVDAAVAELQAAPKSAEADELLCSLYASINQRDQAIATCEAAAKMEPANSNYALALARAYGAKADHSGALTGMRMVGKIRSSFERAVQLDGNNVEALSDLGQFYVEAPGVVGGGAEKARALLPKLQPIAPARAHRLAAMIAAKNKDDLTAEQEFQAALAAAPNAEAYVDLANFYRSRKNWQKAADNAKLAMVHDPQHGPDTLDAAKVLLDMKRSEPEAQAGLRSYLNSPQVHVASYAKAHVLLGNSLLAAGNNTVAQTEFQAALALAKDYEAAQQGLRR
ncbi:MAG: tetratricopeptide repeat protein [Janthinobacterium lividum]